MRILCVHGHYELYGSDRCFVDSVAAMRRLFPTARIDVLLPQKGRLAILLKPFADEVAVTSLWVTRKRHVGRLLTRGIFTLPLALARAIVRFRQSDIVYINTVTVVDYILSARFFRHKAVLHVHEAPTGIAGAAFGTLVRAAGIPIIFNSKATRDAYSLSSKVPSSILYNGFRGPKAVDFSSYDGARRLRLLMLGRLSHGKGQDILIEACARLPPSVLKSLEIRIVGSSFEAQLKLEADLLRRARKIGGSDVIRFEPFVDDPGPLLEWCDLTVVPSRVREGFGRVPIEAMAYGRASIVAAHGGLTEIVVNEETGWHFTPNDPDALALQIRRAIHSPESVRKFGRAGRLRFETLFAADLVDRQFQEIVRKWFE